MEVWQQRTFSVKYVYNAMTANDFGSYAKTIWKGKIPSKIKTFLWMVSNNAILTKDNMIKRKWFGDPACYFCHPDETISHLLFQCSTARAARATVAVCIGADDIPNSLQQCWLWCEKWLPNGRKFHVTGIAAFCWPIWKARNEACFEGKMIQNPISIICHACALISYWAVLFLEGDKELLIAGANTMLQIALKLLNTKQKPNGSQEMEDECKCNQALIVRFGDNDHMIRGLMRFIEMTSM
jgi:hypothetical protein